MILAEESPVAQNAPAVDSIPKRLIASSLTRGGELERPGRPRSDMAAIVPIKRGRSAARAPRAWVELGVSERVRVRDPR